MITQVILAIIKTFLVFGIGAFARWRGYLKQEVLNVFSRFTIDFLMSLMVFDAVSSGLRGQEWELIVIPPALGFFMTLAGAVAGLPCTLLLRKKDEKRKSSFMHLCAVNNFLFLPLIIVSEIWGEEHIALLILISVGFTIGQWTIGIMPFGGMKDWRTVIKKLCNPNLVAAVLGVLVAVSNINIPELIAETVTMLGDITVPLMLLVIGAALPDGFKKIAGDCSDLALYSLCRLVVIPLIIIGILKLLPLDTAIYETAMIVAMMPGSSSAVLIIRNYGSDCDFAGGAIITSTIISLATIPALLYILL